MKKIFTFSLALLITNAVLAQFTPGNLVLARYGNGTTDLVSSGTSKPVPLTLVEYNASTFMPTGYSISVPSVTLNQRLAIAGSQGTSFTPEGMITRSADGRYIMVAGANIADDGVNYSTTGSGKMVVRINNAGNIEYAPLTYGNSLRNVASVNGEDLYLDGALSGNGVVKTTFSAPNTQTVVAASVIFRNANIVNGQLYGTGIRSIGAGLPDALDPAPTPLSGVAALNDNMGMLFLDTDPNVSNDFDGNDVLYMTDNTTTGGKGIIKYYYDTTTSQWILADGNVTSGFSGSLFTVQKRATTGLAGYYIPPVAPATTGKVRLFYTYGLAYNTTPPADVSDAGNTPLNSFCTVLDENDRTSVATAPAVTVIATAPAKYFFRSVCFAPEVADNTAPAKVSATSAVTNGNTIEVSWVAPITPSADFSNYTVVRYSTNPAVADKPADKTNYNVGSTVVNNNTGTVVYRGPKVTFSDNTISANGTYYYRVYAFDHSFNYAVSEDASSAVVLPLDFISFTGSVSGNTAQFKWVTANEKNVKGFTLEKRTEGSEFTATESFSARNTAVQQIYRAEDINIAAGTTYYRIKMTDNDGTFKYSNIVALSPGGEKRISIYPNPVTDVISVKMDNGINTQSTITLTDMQGKIISEKSVTTSQTSLNVSTLNKGIYILSISQNGKLIEKQKIIKN